MLSSLQSTRVTVEERPDACFEKRCMVLGLWVKVWVFAFGVWESVFQCVGS